MKNMDGVNEPKEVISEEDYAKIAEELIERFDFEGELDDEELAEFDAQEAAIVANYDTYIDMAQLNRDLVDGSFSKYLPAQVIRVIAKRSRTLPTGQIVLEYDLEVQDVAGAKSYEVRVQER